MFSGITYLGKHSYKDHGVTMANSREISIPNKKKTKLTLPYSNVVYDYSMIFGSQTYEERTIKYTFNIAGRQVKTKDQMNWLKTVMINWLMNSNGKQPLYDDYYRGYYFLAEVEGSASFVENWTYGFLEVTFTAYPFMISTQPEGHDIWDDFNFLFDVSQPVNFNIPASQANYKALAIGSQATIASWATSTVFGTRTLVNDVGISGKILSVATVTTTTRGSTRAYTIQGMDGQVYEQDIIEACNTYLDVTLINNGTASVFPELTLTNSEADTPKVSIKNTTTGLVYNFSGTNPDNYIYQLDSGENQLRLYSLPAHTIQFTFHKELI